MNDEAAILLAREGDEDAFRSLYDHHRERIYRIAFRYTRSVHDAEDILQETFVRAFRRIGDFRPRNEASFGAWLASICINRSIDHMRKTRTRKVDATVTLEEALNTVSSGGGSPHAAAETEETLRIIEEAARELTPKQRVAFDLRYNDHLSIKEISELMSCSEAAVKTHLARSIRKLKAHLEPLWRDE